ncbi:leucyl aminopeptidase [Glaciecola sp. MF2-115]|uniref:leucyl aminopeptidase n=1 Tax=Glaciecola sp. MF2-115 TaxID=3384827 RepID=UPI00399FC9A4
MDLEDTPITIHHVDQYPAVDIDCLIFPVFKHDLSLNNIPINNSALDHIKSVIDYENFTGEASEIVITHGDANGKVRKFVVIGLGEQDSSNISSLRKALSSMFATLSKHNQTHLGLCIPSALNDYVYRMFEASVYSFCGAQYQFHGYKTKAQPFHPKLLSCFTESEKALNAALPFLMAEQIGIATTKDLANMPANICTPDYLAKQCEWLGSQFNKITTTIIDEQALFELNMHSYLAVNQASSYRANMPVMEYKGADENHAPIVLIGKGVTFDTGGISIKGAAGMESMIYDMAGAASVFGLMHAIAILDLKINVVVILATAENCIDGNAYRPGDVLETMSGQTVEVISTDAEGRLLLCDAISYAKCFNPSYVIDIATLTGAAITSLGHHATGLMGNDETLQTALVSAGKARHDRAWAFPLWNEYMATLESTSADMKNTGSNSPGMITAGCFLSKFAKGVRWAHLDIAGTSFTYGKQNTATGRPLPMLLKFIAEQAHALVVQ